MLPTDEPKVLGIDGNPAGSADRENMRKHILMSSGVPLFGRPSPYDRLVQTEALTQFYQHTRRSVKTIEEFYRMEHFYELSINRLVMGALRYGARDNPEKPKYNRVNSVQRRITAYMRDNNLEHLVDSYNEIGLEYTEPMRDRDRVRGIRILVKAPVEASAECKKFLSALYCAFQPVYVPEQLPDALVKVGRIILQEYLHPSVPNPVFDAGDDVQDTHTNVLK